MLQFTHDAPVWLILRRPDEFFLLHSRWTLLPMPSSLRLVEKLLPQYKVHLSLDIRSLHATSKIIPSFLQIIFHLGHSLWQLLPPTGQNPEPTLRSKNKRRLPKENRPIHPERMQRFSPIEQKHKHRIKSLKHERKNRITIRQLPIIGNRKNSPTFIQKLRSTQRHEI